MVNLLVYVVQLRKVEGGLCLGKKTWFVVPLTAGGGQEDEKQVREW